MKMLPDEIRELAKVEGDRLELKSDHEADSISFVWGVVWLWEHLNISPDSFRSDLRAERMDDVGKANEKGE